MRFNELWLLSGRQCLVVVKILFNHRQPDSVDSKQLLLAYFFPAVASVLRTAVTKSILFALVLYTSSKYFSVEALQS